MTHEQRQHVDTLKGYIGRLKDMAEHADHPGVAQVYTDVAAMLNVSVKMLEESERRGDLLADGISEASRLCNNMFDDGPWGRIERVDNVLRGCMLRFKLDGDK